MQSSGWNKNCPPSAGGPAANEVFCCGVRAGVRRGDVATVLSCPARTGCSAAPASDAFPSKHTNTHSVMAPHEHLTPTPNGLLSRSE